MKKPVIIAAIVVVVLLAGAGVVFFASGAWKSWRSTDADTGKKEEGPTHSAENRLKLSPQARANLRLLVTPLKLETYQRTIQVPGEIVEQRGKGDSIVVAPVAGIVQAIGAFPGDSVDPGEPFVTLRINSDPLQTSQTELFKAAQEIKITQDQKKRLESIPDSATLVPPQKFIDLQYQVERFEASRRAYRADLSLKGLSTEEITRVESGQFVKEIIIRVPKSPSNSTLPASESLKVQWEVEDLKIQIGDQVVAGQVLGRLANHQFLHIEGRGFREDTSLIEKTITKGWAVEAHFLEEKDSAWPPLEQPLTIRYMANIVDSMSQTFPFYVSLRNQHREYKQEEKTYRIWRFRPGQRVQLGVPVQKFNDVFVLHAGAVVREGPEAFVFRQNGDYFDRKPVHVVYEDSTHVVLANDGSVFPGNYVAQNAAEALNRALKAKAEGGKKDEHAGHNH